VTTRRTVAAFLDWFAANAAVLVPAIAALHAIGFALLAYLCVASR
jgi:hypothetical protein